jgi:hypothetical protein
MVLFIDADAPGSWREKWVAIQKHLRAAPRRQGLVWLWIVVVELPGSCPSWTIKIWQLWIAKSMSNSSREVWEVEDIDCWAIWMFHGEVSAGDRLCANFVSAQQLVWCRRLISAPRNLPDFIQDLWVLEAFYNWFRASIELFHIVSTYLAGVTMWPEAWNKN